MLIILSLLSILSILIISLTPGDGVLSFGFFTGGGVTGLGNKASVIDLPDHSRRLYIKLI